MLSPAVLSDRLAGSSILGCRVFCFLFFSFQDFEYTLLPPCGPPAFPHKNPDSLVGDSLYVALCSSLAPFKSLLSFAILLMICLDVDLFGFILFGILYAFWTWICLLL